MAPKGWLAMARTFEVVLSVDSFDQPSQTSEITAPNKGAAPASWPPNFLSFTFTTSSRS
jgi:hypothetical protein